MILPEWWITVILAYLTGLLTGALLNSGTNDDDVGTRILVVVIVGLMGFGTYFVFALIKTFVFA